MRLILIFLFFCTTNLIHTKDDVKESPFYGAKITAKEAISFSTLSKNFLKFENKLVVLEAIVEKVCAQKGCWMTFKVPENNFRVKFHNYSFFVPLSLIGKKVWVEGKVARTKLSVEEKRHYLEDEGKSKEEILTVVKPSFEYQFTAKGVKVLN